MRRFFAGFVLAIFLIPALLLAFAAMGFFSVKASDDPPTWEKRLAAWTFNASLRRAARLPNPVPATSEELLAGMRFYRNGCAGCHGDGRSPSSWGSTGFYPRAPQFGSAPPDRPDWQMFSIVKFGVRYSGMGGWEKLASDREIWQTVTFLSRLRSLPPEVEEQWRKPAP
jgi:mono/diheme cytochrome c family protein